jgi:1-acyl-sn-glycerol-3-phosphate acyltransferase
MRFLAWVLVSTFYRIRTAGAEHIPQHGPALLVCNHVSFVDAIVILGEAPRPIRFVMEVSMFRSPLLNWLFRSIGAIGIASQKDEPAVFEKANRLIDEALAGGELVCIFPEGRITKTGELSPFRAGAVRIAERNRVPVVPMALRGLWGSWASRASGRAFQSIPRPLREGAASHLELVVGVPMTGASLTPAAMEARVLALRGTRK